MSENIKFPKNFLWGAATSAHQVEGGNVNNWSEWEKKNAERLASKASKEWANWQQEKFPEMFKAENYISGRACDHYNRFEEDFDMAKAGGHNAHRFSIEWSRIEPEEGKFDEKEIEHYRKVILALRERGLEPFVTLWHWTDPLWITEMGGWENKNTINYFLRFIEKIADSLGDEINFWMVINEPNVYTGMSYVQGNFPPCVKSIWRAYRVLKNLVMANNQAYVLIHKKLGDRVKIGSAHNLISHLPYRKDYLLDRISAKLLGYIRCFKSFDWAKGYQDFIGMNYYHLEKIEFTLRGKRRWYLFNTHVDESKVTDLGWEIYPEGIYKFLLKMKKYNLPVYITENGIADARDEKRGNYIREHLSWINKAMQEGVDVRGFFYWSLLDNFEWDKGFWPRFGLIEMDYQTLERKPRKSYYAYRDIIKENQN